MGKNKKHKRKRRKSKRKAAGNKIAAIGDSPESIEGQVAMWLQRGGTDFAIAISRVDQLLIQRSSRGDLTIESIARLVLSSRGSVAAGDVPQRQHVQAATSPGSPLQRSMRLPMGRTARLSDQHRRELEREGGIARISRR